MAVNLLLLDVAEGVVAGWGIIITLETESTCKSLIYCIFQMFKCARLIKILFGMKQVALKYDRFSKITEVELCRRIMNMEVDMTPVVVGEGF